MSKTIGNSTIDNSHARAISFAKKIRERQTNPRPKIRIWIKLDNLMTLQTLGDAHGDIFLAKEVKLKFEAKIVEYEGD